MSADGLKRALGLLLAAGLAAGCVAHAAPPRRDAAAGSPMAVSARESLLDELERAHFQYFVTHTDPVTGLTKDRSTAGSAASIAAVGFALTAWPIAVKRGWKTRAAAAAYTRKVLKTFQDVPMGPQAAGVGGYKGFYYHFLDMKTGHRTWNCELSTIDTALLMAGVRFARTYFDQPAEADIREGADALFARVEHPWALDGKPLLSMGWTPEKGFIPYPWKAYNESLVLILPSLYSQCAAMPASAVRCMSSVRI